MSEEKLYPKKWEEPIEDINGNKFRRTDLSDKDLISLKEACELFGVSENEILNLAIENKIVCFVRPIQEDHYFPILSKDLKFFTETNKSEISISYSRDFNNQYNKPLEDNNFKKESLKFHKLHLFETIPPIMKVICEDKKLTIFFLDEKFSTENLNVIKILKKLIEAKKENKTLSTSELTSDIHLSIGQSLDKAFTIHEKKIKKLFIAKESERSRYFLKYKVVIL